jgi:WS/DGAT/MGAT family acyltransferase
VSNDPGDRPAAGAEPVSCEDATLLCATTPEAQLQIGALCRFDGGPLRDAAGRLRVDDLHAHVASRLHLIARFRQRIRRVPLDLTRPVWVDDTHLDLTRHLRTATLPAPGGPEELRRFVAGLLGRPLDPAHPLWDLWAIDGADGGDVYVVLRAHHALADGLSLLRAAIALLDLEEHPAPGPTPPPWHPAEAPDPVTMLAGALVDRGAAQVRLAAGLAREALDPRRVAGVAAGMLGALRSPPRTAAVLPLTGRVGTRRDFVWASLPFGPLHDLAHRRGVTLNDVVLAAVTGALRRVLGADAAGDLAGRPPRVLVPMGDTAGSGGGNVFSFVVTDLPVHLDDPAAVVARIHDDMEARKSSGQSAEVLSLFSVVDVLPVPVLRRLGPEVLARQPFVNLAVTNLPGSELPLHLLGSRLRELHPIVTGVGNIACIVGVLSYLDDLGVGITVDPDVVPDPERLLAALRDETDALLALPGA